MVISVDIDNEEAINKLLSQIDERHRINEIEEYNLWFLNKTPEEIKLFDYFLDYNILET